MKKNLTIFLCSLIASYSSAQSFSSSVVGSAGEHYNSATGSLEWTLGEILTETYQQGDFYLTQGFHQPTTINVTGIDKVEGSIVLVYPNPARDILYIKTSENGNYHLELFNLQGQRLTNETISIDSGIHVHEIHLQDFRAAIYLLRISDTITGRSYHHKVEKY